MKIPKNNFKTSAELVEIRRELGKTPGKIDRLENKEVRQRLARRNKRSRRNTFRELIQQERYDEIDDLD